MKTEVKESRDKPLFHPTVFMNYKFYGALQFLSYMRWVMGKLPEKMIVIYQKIPNIGAAALNGVLIFNIIASLILAALKSPLSESFWLMQKVWKFSLSLAKKKNFDGMLAPHSGISAIHVWTYSTRF